MFGLIRLAGYGLLGYTLYELVRGIARMGGQGGGGQPEEPAQFGGAGPEQDYAHRQNMTGPGVGMTVETQEPMGTSVTHRVGRGVVRR